MKTVLNAKTILWITGILQPVSAPELCEYLNTVLDDAGNIPTEAAIQQFCLDRVDRQHLVRVSRGEDMFSLSHRGNQYLTDTQRKSRDKYRIYLLRDAARHRLVVSRDAHAEELGGGSPSVDARSPVKGTEANKLGPVVPSGQVYWPRFSKQLSENTGSLRGSRDTYFPYLSFASAPQLAVACSSPIDSYSINFTSLGLMMGLSPKLILQIAKRPTRHYRSFELPKRSGGMRTIESPRVFMKVIQKFLLDYFLNYLPVSDSVFSYKSGASIIQNAAMHTGKCFVANMDIKDFFGSITTERVRVHLLSNGFDQRSANLICSLVTKDGYLPQGAPTSPLVSNSFLFKFDDRISRLCKAVELTYSRYADDITISGDKRDVLEGAIRVIQRELDRDYDLFINSSKTRITSKYGQQKVTGLVVNEYVLPPRKLRRSIRAQFHAAKVRGSPTIDEVRSLSGYLSYLNGFEKLRGSRELAQYHEILSELKTNSK